MKTVDLKHDWNLRSAILSDATDGVRLDLLAPLLRYAAVNAPVADSTNLLRLLESSPAAQGTLVPERHAPTGLPRVEVVVRASRLGKAPAVLPAALPPPPRLPVLPESFRTAVQNLGAETLSAAEILATVSEEETCTDYEALRAAAGGLSALTSNATADPGSALRELEATAAALAQARAANELATFVLGDTGDTLAQQFTELINQARDLRDLTPIHAPQPAAAVAAAPEWASQRWVDLTPCLDVKVLREKVAERREVIATAGLPEDLEETLFYRFPDEEERTAAAQVATFIIASAAGLDEGELPSRVSPGRMGDVLAAGVDAAMGWLRPILRAAEQKVGYGDSSWRVVPAAPVVADRRSAAPATPIPVVEKAATEIINTGDWIEWDEVSGQTRRGLVDSVWQVGPLVPGRKCVPHDEYSVKDVGSIGPDRHPRRVSGPVEATIAAEFLASPGAQAKDADLALARRLSLGLPAAEAPKMLAGDHDDHDAGRNGAEDGTDLTGDDPEAGAETEETGDRRDIVTDADQGFTSSEVEMENGDENAISGLGLHAGTHRAWFLNAPARDRVDSAPWSALVGVEGVNPADYILVAEIHGAHAHEVFSRLQNGLSDWADAVDPGATVRLNMDAPDGRLRRRSMDYGDLLEDVQTGACYVVGADDLMLQDAVATELGLVQTGSPRWQLVQVREGFVDPLAEELEMVTVGTPPRRGGHGR